MECLTSGRDARPSPGERRPVTAVFCDLVDSVPMALRLDPEDLAEVTNTYLATCHRVLSDHGGHIVQYMGDGVLAYFGYPRAGEGDAAQAVRAALVLVDSVAKLDLAAAPALRVRVGVATGVVVISDLTGRGVGRETGFVGEAPNLAARLQSIAAPGRVLISSATERLIRGVVASRSLGLAALKGFPEPVAVHEAVGNDPIAGRFQRRARAGETPLVGRDAPLAELLGHWRAARAGSGRLVLLRGEAGVGKSRLVEELRRRAGPEPRVEVMWYCSPRNTHSPLYPVIQQIVRSAGVRPGDDAERRHGKLKALLTREAARPGQARRPIALLMGLAPESVVDPRPGADADDREAAMQAAVIDMMDHVSRDRPALFVLEDAHWSDPATLALLDRAAALAAGRPRLIVVTARPPFSATWMSSEIASVLDVGALSPPETLRLCGHLDAEARLRPDTLTRIVERCDGIPLFVEEVTRSMLAAVAEGSESADLPMTLQAFLIARLDRLGPARRIARVAAVIGRSFPRELLALVLDPSEAAQLDSALEALIDAGLIEGEAAGDAVCRFRHALIRDAAYESLLRSDRRILHGRVARAILERFPTLREAEPERIAHHLAQSGQVAAAAPFWVKSAVIARQRGGGAAAVAVLENALELLRDHPADAARARVQLQLLHCASLSRGLPPEVIRQSRADTWAICLAIEDGADRFSLAYDVFNEASTAGDLAIAEDAARLCLDIAERAGRLDWVVDGLQSVGFVLFMRGDLLGARSALLRAAGLCRRDDVAGLISAATADQMTLSLGLQMLIADAVGDDAAAEAARLELRTHARLPGRPIRAILALEYLATFAILARDEFAAVIELTDEAIAISRRAGLSAWETIDQFYRAIALAHLSDLEGGLREAVFRLGQLRRVGLNNFIVHGLAEVARLKAMAGDAAGALAGVDEALAEAGRMGEHVFLSLLYRRRAEILAQAPGVCGNEIHAALRRSIVIAEAQGAAGYAARAVALSRAPRFALAAGAM
jgi:class 3 adenylate cyclase